MRDSAIGQPSAAGGSDADIKGARNIRDTKQLESIKATNIAWIIPVVIVVVAAMEPIVMDPSLPR